MAKFQTEQAKKKCRETERGKTEEKLDTIQISEKNMSRVIRVH